MLVVLEQLAGGEVLRVEVEALEIQDVTFG